MLIVAGEFVVDPDLRDEFLHSREALMRASRGEAGCLDYVFSADPLEPGRVVLFERWESEEALEGHLAALRSSSSSSGPRVPALRQEILRYEIASSAAL